MDKKIAVCPGSFDPVTVGHLDIIKRSSPMFEKVIVLVSVHPAKKAAFTAEERVEMIRKATANYPNVEVDHYTGLLIDYVRQNGIHAIIRGLRAVTDFEYEFQMALTNRKMYPEAETLFLTTTTENMYLSSSMVKELAYFGGDITDFVAPVVHDFIKERLSRKDA